MVDNQTNYTYAPGQTIYVATIWTSPPAGSTYQFDYLASTYPTADGNSQSVFALVEVLEGEAASLSEDEPITPRGMTPLPIPNLENSPVVDVGDSTGMQSPTWTVVSSTPATFTVMPGSTSTNSSQMYVYLAAGNGIASGDYLIAGTCYVTNSSGVATPYSLTPAVVTIS